MGNELFIYFKMGKQVFLGIKILAVIFFICVTKNGYAKRISVDTNGIYIGAYSINFNGSREAKITIPLPDGFRNNLVGWSPGSWPTNYYGITGFSIQPCMVSRYEFLGSQIDIWVKAHMWDGQQRIQLIMDTNKPSPHHINQNYYYLYADIDIMGLK